MRRVTSFTCDEDLWLRFRKDALNHGLKLGEHLERVLSEHLATGLPTKNKVMEKNAEDRPAKKRRGSRFRGDG